jgi:hypothetical protein
MSIEAIRSAFQAAAGNELRLERVNLTYSTGHQVLTFTGWHSTGLPFAVTTAPFDGHPVERAGKAATAIIAAHGVPTLEAELLLTALAGRHKEKPMSQKGSGLARLMGGLRALDSGADALAGRLETAMANLTAEMATTTQIVGNVEASVNDLKAVNALYSNGMPSPTPGSSEPSQS